mmetsp:Transcript_32732/g.91669  ORF Transcript_32732/g.91669 Transcript_32732/m.91669 type:complete len:293 (-) Transcript_32732:349-1227(-)
MVAHLHVANVLLVLAALLCPALGQVLRLGLFRFGLEIVVIDGVPTLVNAPQQPQQTHAELPAVVHPVLLLLNLRQLLVQGRGRLHLGEVILIQGAVGALHLDAGRFPAGVQLVVRGGLAEVDEEGLGAEELGVHLGLGAVLVEAAQLAGLAHLLGALLGALLQPASGEARHGHDGLHRYHHEGHAQGRADLALGALRVHVHAHGLKGRRQRRACVRPPRPPVVLHTRLRYRLQARLVLDYTAGAVHFDHQPHHRQHLGVHQILRLLLGEEVRVVLVAQPHVAWVRLDNAVGE